MTLEHLPRLNFVQQEAVKVVVMLKQPANMLLTVATIHLPKGALAEAVVDSSIGSTRVRTGPG